MGARTLRRPRRRQSRPRRAGGTTRELGRGAQSSFRAKQSPAGAVGRQGPVGQAGPAGPTNNLNLSNVGYCVRVDDNTSGMVSFVDGVSVFAPTSLTTDGFQSVVARRRIAL